MSRTRVFVVLRLISSVFNRMCACLKVQIYLNITFETNKGFGWENVAFPKIDHQDYKLFAQLESRLYTESIPTPVKLTVLGCGLLPYNVNIQPQW